MFDCQQYINVLIAAGDFAHGGRPDVVATEWMIQGFSPMETREWLEARCFDAVAAKRLSESGITSLEAAQPYGSDTIGYAVANMDLTIAQAQELLD